MVSTKLLIDELYLLNIISEIVEAGDMPKFKAPLKQRRNSL